MKKTRIKDSSVIERVRCRNFDQARGFVPADGAEENSPSQDQSLVQLFTSVV